MVPKRGESQLGSKTQNELKRKKLASTRGLLVLLSRAQFLAEHFRCPVRYRLCGLTQLAADELGHYAKAAAMSCVVVDEQFISMFGDFGKILGRFPIGVNHAGHGHGLPASTHAHQHPPHIQICVFRRNKKNLRRKPCCPRLVEQLRVHTNVFHGKRTPIIKKWLLLVSQWGNKCWEWLFQKGFIESCFTGAHRSCDYEQCWLLLAQDAISSCAILCGPFRRAGSKFVTNSSMGVRSPSGVTFTVAFRLRSYS